MERLRFKFDEEKSAQAVAFLIRRAAPQPLTKGYLVKMLYVADCRQVSRVGSPITGDQPTAMENGPVLSHILDLFNGKTKSPFWSRYFSTADRESVIRQLSPIESDLLSQAEKKSLSLAVDRLKGFSWSALVDHLHRREEWIKHNRGRSSAAIPFESILEAEGRDASYAEQLQNDQAEQAMLSQLLA